MEPVHYCVARPPDEEQIILLLANVFSQPEPPSVAVGLSFRDIKQYLQLVAPRIIQEGLMVLARSIETGELAGVFLTDDFACPPARRSRPDQPQVSAHIVYGGDTR